MDRQIDEYIRTNRDRYTREAITQQLMDAGHERDAIDAAWDRLTREPGPPPTAQLANVDDERRKLRRWSFLVYVTVFAAVMLAAVAVFDTDIGPYAGIVAIVLGFTLLIGWGVSMLIGRALVPHTGLLVALAVPVLAALVVGGSCLAIMQGMSGPPDRQGAAQLRLESPAFEGSGPATCYGDASTRHVSIYATDLGSVGSLAISVSTEFEVPNASLAHVAVELASGAEGPGFYYSSAQPGQVDVSTSEDGARGTISFDGLRLEEGGPANPGPEDFGSAITGTFSWSCQ
jgi:hypothetical protein